MSNTMNKSEHKSENGKVIKVSDLYLRAYLSAHDVNSTETSTEALNGRSTVIFTYENTEKVEKLIADYQSDDFLRSFITHYLKTKRDITNELRAK